MPAAKPKASAVSGAASLSASFSTTRTPVTSFLGRNPDAVEDSDSGSSISQPTGLQPTLAATANGTAAPVPPAPRQPADASTEAPVIPVATLLEQNTEKNGSAASAVLVATASTSKTDVNPPVQRNRNSAVASSVPSASKKQVESAANRPSGGKVITSEGAPLLSLVNQSLILSRNAAGNDTGNAAAREDLKGVAQDAAAQSAAVVAAPPAASTTSEQPANAATPVVSPGTTPIGSASPLSFAANIQATQSSSSSSAADTQSQRLVLNPSVTTVASAWKKAQSDEHAAAPADMAAAGPSSAGPNSASTAPSVAQVAQANSAPAQTAKHDDTPLLAAAKEITPATSAQASSGPMKDLAVNIAQPGGSSVQLRMVERSGELRVSVHSASPELSQQLRADLPDLTKKLSDTGFHSEVWRPATQAAAAAPGDAPGTKNQGGNSGGDSQPQSGSQQGGGQREQNQSQRPKWFEELENSTQSAPTSTGDFHGFSS